MVSIDKEISIDCKNCNNTSIKRFKYTNNEDAFEKYLNTLNKRSICKNCDSKNFTISIRNLSSNLKKKQSEKVYIGPKNPKKKYKSNNRKNKSNKTTLNQTADVPQYVKDIINRDKKPNRYFLEPDGSKRSDWVKDRKSWKRKH